MPMIQINRLPSSPPCIKNQKKGEDGREEEKRYADDKTGKRSRTNIKSSDQKRRDSPR